MSTSIQRITEEQTLKHKEVNRASHRRDYQVHKEQRIIYQRNYHKDHLEAARASCRRWYHANKEHARKIALAWYNAHKEQVAAKLRRLRMEDPRKWWAIGTLARHRAYYNVKMSNKELIELARNTSHCLLCGCELDWARRKHKANRYSPTLDRINNEKTITKDNIMIICHRCNTRKSDSTLEEFIAYCKEIARKYGVDTNIDPTYFS